MQKEEPDRALSEAVSMPPGWNSWKLLEQIGEGSFGKVFKAVSGNQICAIKIIELRNSDLQPAFIQQVNPDSNAASLYLEDLVGVYEREIKALAALRGSAHIVHMEDHAIEQLEGDEGYRIFIRMELLNSMPDYLAGKNIHEDLVLRLGLDICEALLACERHGIIHRDIKPENIFVNEAGEFLLGDFGVARVQNTVTGATIRKGTYTFMAPEVYRGGFIDKTADIYSLGLVLFRLLNRGRDPFLDLDKKFIYYRDREQALERRLQGERIPAPADASEEMAAVIRKACAYDSRRRFVNAEALKSALMKVMNPDLRFAEEETLIRQKREAEDDGFGREAYGKYRNRMYAVLIGMAVLCAICAAAIFLHQ